MARLADYLARLAVVFGHKEHVHFLKVRKGSAIPEIHVREASARKVNTRLKLVGTAEAPKDLTSSVQNINAMLREDNASAVLRVKGGVQLIQFPGCKTPLADEAVVHEAGELVGAVIRVGGKDDTVPLTLQDTDGAIYSCTTTRAIARDLAKHLFGDLVRVQGSGKWRRTPERAWELDEFRIKSWEQLDQTPLVDEIKALRAVEGSLWNDFADPQAELKKLRKA
jgi:hypothetical protein